MKIVFLPPMLFALGLISSNQIQAKCLEGGVWSNSTELGREENLNLGWQCAFTNLIDRSAKQSSDGKPLVAHYCKHPETLLCTTTVFYRAYHSPLGDHLADYTMSETKDAAHGNVLYRGICLSDGTKIGSERICTNWGAQVTTTERKDWNGWSIEKTDANGHVLLPIK